MNKFKVIAVSSLSAVALILTGCSGNNGSTQTICVDRKTQVRYSDDRCNRNDSNMIWWYLPSNKSKPKVNHKVVEGSSTAPKVSKPTTKPKADVKVVKPAAPKPAPKPAPKVSVKVGK